ncbi:hypothetical protein SAMN05192541_15259 [Bradyrhizobium arachidis]|jgi:hypothetical protein|nr:hypothetical protein SAMN05192541_15259 [Bradyrhizobium arachidis]
MPNDVAQTSAGRTDQNKVASNQARVARPSKVPDAEHAADDAAPYVPSKWNWGPPSASTEW